uniref:HSF-type DNA-binding domain-containing protein n=1 Tax=Trieres chinensis TaxID=1514140 RepID=A0A7S1YYJ9_TRICV|mmetsp:Transcript_13738/g.28267  ORF Transcript_13738/g.28267 Transcript_13738/m.28267 type:complete len:407 (+) Transcript_13738:251-1471(+)|eukprot:CAMPEP_0183314446 /NCGR_PEP_ID=MMETSP0160_2-20130417/48480_1 /TAXON_ID=2839 ORGANISM="Odontella Sinensis, Strain Grunow 1884" /NCGR_SAMPLE_ID=MMETSP0160_2 /ASSEMBLY_ACC=CAM_ASM_000250 /LENGTH=406 /DNA_ID=CAMNT_0025479787 /DNA_START=176 /DNA_END=1396 /DNA_ORIENTATION=-
MNPNTVICPENQGVVRARADLQQCANVGNFSPAPQAETKGQRKSKYVPKTLARHPQYQDRSAVCPLGGFGQYSPSRGGVVGVFPMKMHQALERMDQDDLGHVCSWQPHGRAFVVHKTKEFESILPVYFGKMKLASFQRQLNLYGFRRLTHGQDKGGYYHEFFLRGRKYLCHKIRRIRVKGTGKRSADNPEDEPNFYAMPFVGPVDAVEVACVIDKPFVDSQNLHSPKQVKSKIETAAQESNLHKEIMSLPVEKSGIPQRLESSPVFNSSFKSSSSLEAEDDTDSELDSFFWESMEQLLLDEKPVSAEPDPISPNVETKQALVRAQESALAAASVPTPSSGAHSSASLRMDTEIADFLQTLFLKDYQQSTKPSQSEKEHTTQGAKNAAAWARRGAFNHHNSSRANAA